MEFKKGYYLTRSGDLAEVEDIINDEHFPLRGRLRIDNTWYVDSWDADGFYMHVTDECSFDLLEPPYYSKTLQELLDEYPHSYFDGYGHLVLTDTAAVPSRFFRYLGRPLTLQEASAFPLTLVKGVSR